MFSNFTFFRSLAAALCMTLGFVAFDSPGQNRYSDLHGDNLHGPVLSVKLEWYHMMDNRWVLQDVTSYNDSGNVSTKVEYYSDGGVMRRTSRDYDAQGSHIRTTEYFEGKLEYDNTYVYDDQGRYMGFRRLLGSGEQWDKWVVERDSKGINIGYTYWGGEGVFSRRCVYERDARGDVVKTHHYAEDGAWRKTDSTAYFYNGTGELIEEREYTDWNTKITKYVNGTRSYVLDQNAPGQRTNVFRNESFYNAHGDEVESNRSSESGPLVVRYFYEYDAYGNWIEQHDLSPSGAKGGYKRRTIVYR